MVDTLVSTAPLTLRARLGDPRTVADMILEADAIRDGHFELLGGAHSDRFIHFSRIAEDDARLHLLADWFLPTVAAWVASAVVAPSTAGVALGATIARRLGIPFHLADVDDDGRAVRVASGEALSGTRALLVNDVVTTGAGLQALAHATRATGATIAGAAWFLSRAEVDVERLIAAPAVALAEVSLDAWTAEACPLCQRDEPLTRAVEVN